jgi:hypothetical protein
VASRASSLLPGAQPGIVLAFWLPAFLYLPSWGATFLATGFTNAAKRTTQSGILLVEILLRKQVFWLRYFLDVFPKKLGQKM